MEVQDHADSLPRTLKVPLGEGTSPKTAARFRHVLVKIHPCHGFQIVFCLQPALKQLRGKHRIEIGA